MSGITLLEDDSPMPFGKEHRDKPMREVPVGYLHWMWKNKVHAPAVQDYIKRNLSALQKEDEDRIWE